MSLYKRLGEAAAGFDRTEPVLVGKQSRKQLGRVTMPLRRSLKHGERVDPDQFEEGAPAPEWDERISISVSGDYEPSGLRKMLEHIRDTASGGHSFNVVVDPETSEYRKTFGFDGDGAFRMEIE